MLNGKFVDVDYQNPDMLVDEDGQYVFTFMDGYL